jgi:hypothetical protein
LKITRQTFEKCLENAGLNNVLIHPVRDHTKLACFFEGNKVSMFDKGLKNMLFALFLGSLEQKD